MYESWYQEHYHEMSGVGRWFHGGGINVPRPQEWDARPYRVLIVRLSTGRDTADSFTHQLLFQNASSCEGVFADCAWLPPPEDAALFDTYEIPWLIGVITKRPAMQFDCVAISNSIVQELINIPTLLRKSNIPIGKRERIGRPDVPFVILGGANALFTAVLLNDDPPVDAIFVGEDEASIKQIFSFGQKGKLQGEDKRTLLGQLSGIPGIIEPDKPKMTRKLSIAISPARQLQNAPVFSGEGKAGIGSLQISEGCPCFCTFCAESWSRKPYREIEAKRCVDSALAMKKSMGLDRIDLYGFNFNMHSRIKDLLLELSQLFSVIGLKSQRLDGIAADPEIMKLLHAVNKSSITVGIEGISKRLRSRLQKGLNDPALRLGLTRILQSPIRELKLFFLAIGSENEKDMDEFRDLLAFISETMINAKRHPRIIISMTPLVRFPFTPHEHDDAPDGAEVLKIIQQCERLTEAKRFEFRSAASINEYDFSQVFVRPGDDRLWKILCDTVQETGFVYYRDIPDDFMEALKKRLQQDNLTLEDRLKANPAFKRMPIQLPIGDGFMEEIRKSSEALSDLGNCLGTENSEGACLGCGACSDEEHRKILIARRDRSALRGEEIKARVLESNKTINVIIKCRIAEKERGLSRSMIAAEMAKAFMATDDLLARLYRGFSGSLVADRCESD